MSPVTGTVVAVGRSGERGLAKAPRKQIRLLEHLGVECDVHLGRFARHTGRPPDQPNLRQVHLMHEEFHDELRSLGFYVGPGEMGENVTTRGIELLALPRRTRLVFAPEGPIVEITGLRNPCVKLDQLGAGLMSATVERAPDNALVRKAGVMGIVVRAGVIAVGDAITVEIPGGESAPLEPV